VLVLEIQEGVTLFTSISFSLNTARYFISAKFIEVTLRICMLQVLRYNLRNIGISEIVLCCFLRHFPGPTNLHTHLHYSRLATHLP